MLKPFFEALALLLLLLLFGGLVWTPGKLYSPPPTCGVPSLAPRRVGCAPWAGPSLKGPASSVAYTLIHPSQSPSCGGWRGGHLSRVSLLLVDLCHGLPARCCKSLEEHSVLCGCHTIQDGALLCSSHVAKMAALGLPCGWRRCGGAAGMAAAIFSARRRLPRREQQLARLFCTPCGSRCVGNHKSD